jgi:hypothetical protein
MQWAIDFCGCTLLSLSLTNTAGASLGRRDLTARRVVSYHGFHGRRDFNGAI